MHRITRAANTAHDPRKGELTRPRQRLVSLAQYLVFGSIHNLRVVRGEPVLDPPPRTIRRRKNGGQNQPRGQVESQDFALKQEWVGFFRDLDEIGDGTILLIEVAHGLPLFHEFEDVIAV